jgi:hypothetical protein
MYVYKITISTDAGDKFYIGKCSTGDPNYCGSGKILKRYYKKYGTHIIKEKQILFETNDEFDLAAAEKQFIEKYNAVRDPMFLNIAAGGEGGNTFAGLTKAEIDDAMHKRQQFYLKNPNALQKRIDKYKETVLQPHVKEKIKSSIERITKQRVESYKHTCSKRTDEQKEKISSNISDAVKEALKNLPESVKKERKNKEMDTKRNKSLEAKNIEKERKSRSSKAAASKRSQNTEEKLLYSKKVSEGVQRWKKSLTSEEIDAIKFKYRETMYTKNGMLKYKDDVINMILNKSSIEIFYFLKDKGIHTHHICVKGFIDFLKSYYNV